MILGSVAKLNLIPNSLRPTVHVNETDSGCELHFRIYNGTMPYNVPEGITATIRGTKGDGKGYAAEVTTQTGSNLVVVTLTEQMTAVAGIQNIFEIVFADSNGLRVGTANFVLAVEKAALNGDTVISDSDIAYAEQVLNELQSVSAVNTQVQQNKADIASEISTRQSETSSLRSDLSSETSTRASADALLQNEIDQIIAPSGEAPSAAEIQNARIGADGVTYPTLGDAIRTQNSNLKSHLDVVNPATELSWTLKKSINANGVITDSNYTALTDFVRKCGKVTIVRKSPQKDSSNYALSFMVSQFNEDTFISRTNLAHPGDSITLEDNCTKYAIAFGRSSGSGVIIQQTDIDNLFDADIYTEADNFKYGLVPTDTVLLSSITAPGCYKLELANYATLEDLPADYPKNTTGWLICLKVKETQFLQLLSTVRDGYIWNRMYDVVAGTMTAWFEASNSKYLTNVENSDANSISWNGWYGWGSTEQVSHVPSTVGMLLNVVRLAGTKYQLAFDYTTGNVYTRNSKNSVWTDWKRLAFASDIPTTGKTIQIRHESGSFADGAATERLHIYVPAETGYILYLMYHFVDTSNNSDVWQIYNAYQVDDNFDYANRKTLTITGEWECAIHLNGRDDFSGGHTHGDEMMQNVVFLMDGVPVTISDFATLTACNELRLIRNSTMYDPADHTTAIADHGVEYTYSKDGVTIDQSLKWLVAESLTNCFLCMFLPSKAYIDRAAANSDFVVESLPSETGTPLTTITKPESTGVTMWDTTSGMFADVAVPSYPTGLTGGDKMTIHDNSNKPYNKVYFYVCTGGTSAVGELWKSKSVYKIGYKSVT